MSEITVLEQRSEAKEPLLQPHHYDNGEEEEELSQRRVCSSPGVVFSLLTLITMAVITFLCILLVGPSVTNGEVSRHNWKHGHRGRARMVEADIGVVAADHVICSDAGVRILKLGGNAVDAAITTAFCEGVANPAASGIGGGDFMLIRMADGTVEAFDFRETAPLEASETMYANNLAAKSSGGLSVAVPGEVKGLYMVWQKYGTLPWEILMQPAIRLAADGFPIFPYLAAQIQSSLSTILLNKALKNILAPGGVPLVEGDILLRKRLSETLIKISKGGSDAFYYGKVAKALAQDVQAAGGILSMRDLANYKVRVTKPTVADVLGHTVIGFPLPSSGGLGLTLILHILEAFNDTDAIKGDLGLHHIVEAMKHTYAVRSHLGDDLFVNVSGVVADMVSREFATTLRKAIADNTTFPSEHYGGKYNSLGQRDDHGTSHFSIVDGNRNAVSMTCTINYSFGSKLISEQTGILLNNEMDDFATLEDDNSNGPPAKPNFIEPNKRPLSTMSPTILLENGQLKAVVGGSGGIKILTTVAQVVLNMFMGHDPLTSVNLPRIHHQFMPDTLGYENYTTVKGENVLVPEETRKSLAAKGHVLKTLTSGAMSQFIVHDLMRPTRSNGKKNKKVFMGKLIGVSDFRKDGYPAGY